MQGAEPAGQLQPASLLLRGAAFVIDWAIVLLLAVFMAEGFAGQETARFAVLLTTLAAYHVGFLLALGATPGKMAMRMQVTDAAGRRLTADRVLLRYLVFFFGLAALFLGALASAVLAASDHERRTLHDRFAGSIVVKLRLDDETGQQ